MKLQRGFRYVALVLALLAGMSLTASCRREPIKHGRKPGIIGYRVAPAIAEPVSLPTTAKPIRPDTDRRYREHAAKWTASHAAQAKSGAGQCAMCHEPESCVACHQNKLPATHAKTGWVTVHGATPSKDRVQCEICHTGDYCAACHDSARPASHGKDWGTAHGKRSAGAECTICHKPDYCSKCHGLAMPHPEGWTSVHGPASSDALCGRCHKQSYCRDCHGVDLPHPANFVMEHKKHGASLAPDSACFKCHEQKYCGMCHTNM